MRNATARLGLRARGSLRIEIMTEIMRRIEPLERYSGLLLAILLLFVAAPLNAIVYSTAGVKGTDREDALKTLPAVAAHPAGFVIAGLVFILLGGAAFRTRAEPVALRKRAWSAGDRASHPLRPLHRYSSAVDRVWLRT